MEIVTDEMYRSGVDTNDSLAPFKQFFYYVARENGTLDADRILVFRSERRFRQSTTLQYQNLDPQIRTRNFFLLLYNYLLQLHVSGNTDYTDRTTFNNIVEIDLNRRFNTIVFDFMVGINATIERFLVQTPLALIFTENESRLTEHRSLSYRSALHLLLMSATNNTAPNYESSTMVDGQQAAWNMLFHNREEILNAVSEAVKTELKLVVQRVVVPERNKNAPSSTKSYVAYATSSSNSGDLPESIITNYDVDSSDSASQINNNNDDENDLSTVDYNAPNQLIMNRRDDGRLAKVSTGETIVTIDEPQLVTVSNTNVNAVLNVGSVGELGFVKKYNDNDDDVESRFSLPSELQERLGVLEEEEATTTILMNENRSELNYDDAMFNSNTNAGAIKSKNKYSASNDIRESNFVNISSRFTRISNKISRDIEDFKRSLCTSRGERSAIDRLVRTNRRRGLLDNNESATTTFDREKEARLDDIVETARTSVRQLEKINEDRVSSFGGPPSYEHNSRIGKKKKVNRVHVGPYRTGKNTIATVTPSITSKQKVRLATRKRRLIED